MPLRQRLKWRTQSRLVDKIREKIMARIRDRVILRTNLLRSLIALWIIPIVFAIIGFLSYGWNFFSISHLYSYKSTLVSKYIGIPLLIVLAIFVLLRSIELIRGRGRYVEIKDGDLLINGSRRLSLERPGIKLESTKSIFPAFTVTNTETGEKARIYSIFSRGSRKSIDTVLREAIAPQREPEM